MILVKLQGRLGNQMFQYAFAYTTAKRIKSNYYVIQSEFYFAYNLHYFKVRLFEKLFVRIATSWYFRFNKKTICKEYENNKVLFNNEIPIQNNIVYDGYFQTELFFKENKHELKKLFTIKEKYNKLFTQKYNYLFQSSKPIIVMHYRGGDYKNWGGIDYTLPSKYYISALQLIPNYNNYTILIVTDDIKLAQNIFSSINKAQFISDTEINDFQLLLNALYECSF